MLTCWPRSVTGRPRRSRNCTRPQSTISALFLLSHALSKRATSIFLPHRHGWLITVCLLAFFSWLRAGPLAGLSAIQRGLECSKFLFCVDVATPTADGNAANAPRAPVVGQTCYRNIQIARRLLWRIEFHGSSFEHST